MRSLSMERRVNGHSVIPSSARRWRRMNSQRVFILLVALVSIAPRLYSQSNSAISGVVQDTSGGVVPSCTVEATNELTGLQWTALSDSAGRFNITRLPVGDYRVRARVQGFKQFMSETFRLDADQVRSIEVTLSVGAAAESVTVSGTVSQVETV